ncbi:putative transposon-encoded protein [Methanococcus voltae]|uniref:DUF2080 family transposase-associated protein n=1 Tax=Methanococcus voltae TaxID=2188 RepID=UPI001AE8272D|nr:DUF2080 family transposase-associated protein [Methanococcus voltae]MBP2143413.1 putative transposon-encoded protein [Methanococcus voltae]
MRTTEIRPKVFEGTIKEWGNSARFSMKKEYVGKRAILVIVEEEENQKGRID